MSEGQGKDAAGIMSESELAQNIVVEAKAAGWRIKRDPTWRPTAATEGFPDMIAVKDGRQLVWEFKKVNGRVALDQAMWLNAFAQVPGTEVAVIRPTDLEWAYEALMGAHSGHRWPEDQEVGSGLA